MIKKKMGVILAAAAMVCTAATVEAKATTIKENNNNGNEKVVKNQQLRANETAIVNANSGLNLRKAPNTSSGIIRVIPSKGKVNVLSESKGWSKVRYGDNTGYVSSKYLTKNSSGGNQSINKDATVTNTAGEGLNLRASASTNSKVLIGMPEGATIKIIAKSGDWYKASYSGKTGYAHSKYITLNGGSQDKPTGETAINKKGVIYNTQGEGVNLRKSASTNSGIILSIREGSNIEIVSKTGDWYKVKYSGKTGYVFGKYVKVGSTSGGDSGAGSGESAINKRGYIGETGGEGVNLRASNSTSSQKIGAIPQGATVDVLAKKGDWYKVKYSGNTGYVLGKYVVIGDKPGTGGGATNPSGDVEYTASGYVANTQGEGVNLRQGPTTNSSVLAKLADGSVVKIIAKNGSWLKVQYAGHTGYIASQYITIGDKPVNPSNASFEAVYNVMKAHIGSPYVWGGSGEYITDASIATLRNRFPDANAKGWYDTIERKYYNSGYRAFDCSGLMQWGFRQVGVNISRTTSTQVNDGYGVSISDAKPGDLLINKTKTHVGMYIGNGQWIESPSSGNYVRIRNVNWSNIGYVRRVL